MVGGKYSFAEQKDENKIPPVAKVLAIIFM